MQFLSNYNRIDYSETLPYPLCTLSRKERLLHIQNDWRITTMGGGVVRRESDALYLITPPTPKGIYTDAQISDYHTTDFHWRPPLRMVVTARASSSALVGTAGFGFWNQPFMPGQTTLRLPQAVWFFFASHPNNMALAQGVPGDGWKAATISANRLPFLLLAPFTPVGVLLMRVPYLYDRLWPVGQRAIGVSEKLLDVELLAETHTYTLDWRTDGATFSIDGRSVHESRVAPRGPLGFIAWIDNQYAIVTPQGHFGFGLLPVEREQSLVVEYIAISAL
jgi:hypothetical protein